MKVESDAIREFLKSLKYLVDQITETIRSGDDGFTDCINEQVKEIQSSIDSFTILNLTPVTVKEKLELGYLKFNESYYSRKEQGETTAGENIQLYKAGLYCHIKKAIREMKGNDLASVPNHHLHNWIEENTIFNGSKYEKMILSNEWYHSSFNVVEDITNEIIEQRKKAPQQQLFS